MFTPSATLAGNPTPITYTVNDSDGNTSNEATLTVTYADPEVTPSDSAGTSVSGVPATPIANITEGDTINGQPVQLGTDGNATIAPSGVWPEGILPAGITLAPDTGAVSTGATVQPGVYTIEYELCDLLTPANCETATIMITVTGEVTPNDDAGTSVAGIPATPIADITDGDTINGQAVQLGTGGNATIAESGTWPAGIWPAGITLDPATGAVSTDATVQAGTYEMEYELCDLSTPANCQVAMVTIVVEPNELPVAQNDSSAPNQPLGQPVTVETVGNDSDSESKLDPTSVKMIDPSGESVTTLVVAGEGTWVVNPTTGAITFTPEAGFVGDPTDISYTVSDLSGNKSNVATVSIDYEEPAAITGVVWIDTNQDGVIDADEERKAGWTLKIKDADGNVVATTVTDAQGNYSITGLIPAEYTVEFYDAEGTLISTQRTNGVLVAGQSINIPLPLAPVIVANPDLDDNSILLSKSVNKQQISVGDQLYYTIRAENLTEEEIVFDINDNLPKGFKLASTNVKLTHAGADGTFGTDDDTYPTTRVTGTDPVRFKSITLGQSEKAQIGYLVRVGTAAPQGSSVNTAQAFAVGSLTDIASNIATASVETVADTVTGQATLIGKVFHDRDGDGYQDPAYTTGIAVKSDYFGWNGLNLGDLNARVSVLDNPAKHRKVVRMPRSRKNDFKVTTEQGTMITVDRNGHVTESHVGDKAKSLTAQDIRVTTRLIDGVPTPTSVVAMRQPAQVMSVIEITITNYGIQEEGLPGVRLATVKGLVIETDEHGRYNIPDVDGGTRGMGQNFIIKVDSATLPQGARFTTENPRVLRLTGAALERINFGVKLEQRLEQVAQARLNASFFDRGRASIKASNRVALNNIARNIKQYGQGHIIIGMSGQTDLTPQARLVLAKQRAHSIQAYLLERLGHQLMTGVRVEVSSQ
ncbi:SdrD B-like domain-containing protein [Leucothrix arctica]|uniref:OmpA-like domain-containing protein n=1 Tax=Leucothrix arctica TaxID=1481894 RepID=A0A317C347_9GAMM|nr:SdrD B-like domain-containing protein [Leucothrix arctica]PWQ92998.1 hypothetical protein DKT75_21710 [Leucothrix arctica]